MTCAAVQADFLSHVGAWSSLDSLADRAVRGGYGAAVPAFAGRLAIAFRGAGRSRVELPATGCTLPVTYVSLPPLVEGQLGHGASVRFVVSTGQAHTVIAAADTVGADLLLSGDTVEIITTDGLVRAIPALAPRLSFGQMVFRNLLVYVVPDGACTLGLSELSRPGIMDFYGEKIHFAFPERNVYAGRPKKMSADSVFPNLRLTTDGSLLLRAAYHGQPYRLLCNTAYMGVAISNTAFAAAETDTAAFSLDTGRGSTRPVAAAMMPLRHIGADGILGLPFFHANAALRLDFNSMKLESYDNVPTDTVSPLFFRRNLPAVLAPDDATRWERNYALLTEKHLLGAAALPEQVALADTIFGDATARTEMPESMLSEVLAVKQEALAGMGRYAQAAAVSPPVTDDTGIADRMRLRCRVFAALPKEARPATFLPSSVHVVYEDTVRQTFAIVVNHRQAMARLSLDLDTDCPVEISEKMAKRLKVRMFRGTADGSGIPGLVDSLEIGGAVIYNVRCRVISGKDKEIVMGWGLLKYFPAVRFSASGLTILPETERPADTDDFAPAALADGLYIQGETLTGYAAFELHNADALPPVRPFEAARFEISGKALSLSGSTAPQPVARLSLPWLVARFTALTVDLQRMQVKLE